MNLNESIRDWITHRLPDFPDLAPIQLATSGEEIDIIPPFLGIYETSSEAYEQGGVTMYGVTEFEIIAELHTVPAADEEGGTPAVQERAWRTQLYDILGDRAAIEWISGRNQWQVFDMRLPSPTTESQEGQRITRWVMTVVACPL